MKILAGLLLAALVLVSGYTCAVPDGKLRVITEENPPYNFTDERGNIKDRKSVV